MRAIVLRWVRTVRRAPMFRDRGNVIATAVVGACLAYLAVWFVIRAVVNPTVTLPRGAGSSLRFILFGVYPFDRQWRPAVVCLLFVALYAASANRAWWKRWLLAIWIAVPTAAVALLRGGFLGLSVVPSEFWGGLALTFLLSTVGFAAAFPVAVLLAVGRRSQMPAIRALSIAYIELVRGVPLVTFLFMASVMFPLFVPQGFTVDKLLRAQVAFVMVIAAYLAEVVRAGLQAVPRGQYEAASSMGLRFWPAMILIVLPQAVRVTIPALVNTFIGLFKDTSLVAVIGLFDLLGAAKALVVADPRWFARGAEVYLLVAAIYFALCYPVSRYSQHLERVLMARSRHS